MVLRPGSYTITIYSHGNRFRRTIWRDVFGPEWKVGNGWSRRRVVSPDTDMKSELIFFNIDENTADNYVIIRPETIRFLTDFNFFVASIQHIPTTWLILVYMIYVFVFTSICQSCTSAKIIIFISKMFVRFELLRKWCLL